MSEYRVDLYRDNEGREPDTYHLVEYQDGKMAGSAIGAHTTDKTFAGTMANVINDLLRGRDWQPIETAPANVDVLLFCPDGWCESNRARIELGCASYGWRNEVANNMSFHSWATHWMPLPAPPEQV